MFQLVKWINKRCRNAIRQQRVGRPPMVGQASCHGRRARLPASRRYCTAGWLDPRPFLPQAVMGPPHMGVRQRQPQLCCEPWELFAERLGLARASTLMVATRQMLAFDNAGLDGRTRRYRGQERGPALGVSTHDVGSTAITRPRARVFTTWASRPSWGAGAVDGGRAPRATPWRLVPCARHMQQGSAVCRQVSAGTNGDQVRVTGATRASPKVASAGGACRRQGYDRRHSGAKATQTQASPEVSREVSPRGEARLCVWTTLHRSSHGHALTGSCGHDIPRDPPTRRAARSSQVHPVSCIHRDDPRGRPDRMACREGAHGHFTQRRVMLHIDRGGSGRQGDATPTRATHGLALAPRGPMLDQPALVKAHAVKRTARMGTIEGFPVHMILG